MQHANPNSFRTGPDETGHFGIFGGRFVAETLMPLILDLEKAYNDAKADPAFKAELAHLATRAAEPYRDPSGRASSTAILAARREAQAASGALSTTAWRRHWGLEPALRRAT